MDPDRPVKPPVVRGARACTVCRAAKMKCVVDPDDGNGPCQRCKRTNVECVFEKHKRGRKPGSKLSEASKMLRRLEKGLNTAKLKSQTNEVSTDPSTSRSPYNGHLRAFDQSAPVEPEPYPKHTRNYSISSNGSNHPVDPDDDDGDPARSAGDGMFPAKLIRSETRSNSFFRTILNPEDSSPSSTYRSSSYSTTPVNPTSHHHSLVDPIDSGLITEDEAKTLFDAIFLRLNPFANLFDPALHNVHYVRSRCPFLFTTMLMAACKFFKPELYQTCLKLANDFAVKAFAENWKRVEVVQAFACLTYWREPNVRDPNDNRTWTYIGYACRMAVELNLNRYVPNPPSTENELQKLERRNRERTYLVLFVHDRSLSTQHGKNWMLPECELVRNSITWHEQNGRNIRPEDVILVSFVQLRRIVAETTDLFYTPNAGVRSTDVNHEAVLRSCNASLKQWSDTWKHELERAGGESFHWSFINLFHVYVKLFLNSFGIKASLSPSSRERPSLQPLYICFTNAMEALKIVSEDFASMSMLSYSQDSITVMSAYSAVFLLRLLRSSNTFTELEDGAMEDIHSRITQVAEAYHDASLISPACTSIAYHSRFISSLVRDDIFNNTRQNSDRERFIDPALHIQTPQPSTVMPMPPMPANSSSTGYLQPAPPPPLTVGTPVYPPSHQHPSHVHTPSSQHVPVHYLPDGGTRGGDPAMSQPPQGQVQSPQTPQQHPHTHPHQHHHPHHQPHPPPHSSQHPHPHPHAQAHPHSQQQQHAMYHHHPQQVHHSSEMDAQYWKNMFQELGFGEHGMQQPQQQQQQQQQPHQQPPAMGVYRQPYPNDMRHHVQSS